jgi:hypothetical protein
MKEMGPYISGNKSHNVCHNELGTVGLVAVSIKSAPIKKTQTDLTVLHCADNSPGVWSSMLTFCLRTEIYVSIPKALASYIYINRAPSEVPTP